jgi:hypothetical protein
VPPIVKIANSIALAQSALDEGIPFDAAVVDLHLADGNASSLVRALSERGIAVVITTGDLPCRSQRSSALVAGRTSADCTASGSFLALG